MNKPKLTFTSEQKIAHAEIRAAVTNLIYACNHNKCGVVGFAFGATPPMMVRFGNVKEEGPEMTELLLRLLDDPIKPE